MGAWVNYGLGSEAEDLPGFVVMTSVGGRNPQPIASRQWSAGFLPSRFQGVEFNSTGDPVHYVRNPKGVSAQDQKKLVNTITALDRHRNLTINDPETDTRIAAYEMAFKMQTSVPELMDVSKEPQHILDMYGQYREMAPMRPTVCSHANSRRKECASSTSTTGDGITMVDWKVHGYLLSINRQANLGTDSGFKTKRHAR